MSIPDLHSALHNQVGWQNGWRPVSLEGDEYGKRTLDFVQRLLRLTKYDEICREITTELEWFGFSCVTSWSLPGPGGNAADGVMFNTRPQEFIERYCEKNYVMRDPTVKIGRASCRERG